MNVGRGRARRPDDWPSSHVRARAAISEQLDGPIEPTEATWLEAHLAACPDCRIVEGAYAAQQRELWAIRDRMPSPPRDLWARTAAAIEAEPRFRNARKQALGWPPRRVLAPSALLATALVVAVAVGTLTSSQRPGGDGGEPSSAIVALGTGSPSRTPGRTALGPTPMPVTKKIAYVAVDAGGNFHIKTTDVNKVCPSASTTPCDDVNATVDKPVVLDQNASTVFGSAHNERLIVMTDPASAHSGTISVVTLSSETPGPTPEPSATPSAASAPPSSAPPSAAPTATPTATPSLAPASPPASESPAPSASVEPSPSIAITPAPDGGGALEIAHDVVLVGESAAYSPSGDWFAFTARPVDLSAGPDIYVWKVGDPTAARVTSDHRSIFGSWIGDAIVGSTIVESATGAGDATKTELVPASFLLDPATAIVTALPQTGRAWRPAVDPSGRLAVYWAGTVRATTTPGFAPDAGNLVIGDWGMAAPAPSDSPQPTALAGDQRAARHETVIETVRIGEWDARWDKSGTHLALWVANEENPAVGRLSLYAVDSFDGKIDLKNPLLDQHQAVAGYSISDGQLIWAEPPAKGSTDGRVQLLAWTDVGVGTVGTVSGPAIIIR